MKKLILLLLCLSSLACFAQREKTLFNFDWEFSYDQNDWIPVDLPHDYLVGQPWVAPSADEQGDNTNEAANIVSVLSSRAFKQLRDGYYRKKFVPSEEWRGRRVLLDFQGMMLVGDAYLNGEHIGKTDYGYLGFEADITNKLKWGEENLLEVKTEVGGPNNSRWYTGGGLYRDVNVIVTDKDIYFTRHPLQVLTSVAEGTPSDVKKAQVDLTVECTNRGEHPQSLTFLTRILDPQGNEVASSKSVKKYYPRQRTNEYRLDSILIEHPRLWDTETPNLYTAEVSVLDPSGKVVDNVQTRFGIRTIEYGPEYGLKLNGKKTILKGIANHHTLGALGAAAYDKAIEKRLRMLKEFGFNHVRTSHNPYSEGFLDLCDEYGILVVDELYDKWNQQYAGGRTDWMQLWPVNIPEWIRRDRNHPSVVMWSLGNELQQNWDMPYADWGVTVYKLQKTLLNRYDQTRPVTVAMHPRYRNVDTDSIPAPLALNTDIASYNYRYMYFPGDSRRFPDMIFYQSEANTQNMGKNWYEMDLDKVVGLAQWGAIDYLGESMGWPRKGWVLGQFDISLLPKPTAYFLKSYFDEEDPMVHLSVFLKAEDREWNGVVQGTAIQTESWNDNVAPPAGEKLTLIAYTNADEVELLVNGKSYGRQTNDRQNPGKRNKVTFTDVPYAKGKAVAVAYNDGKEVARHSLETTGKPVALVVEGDNDAWTADGLDLQHVRVYAVDSKGRRVYGTNGKLTFTLEGPARIVALSNGDNTCDHVNVPAAEDMLSGEYPLYDGAALVILRAGREAADGKVKLTAKFETAGKTLSKTVNLDIRPTSSPRF